MKEKSCLAWFLSLKCKSYTHTLCLRCGRRIAHFVKCNQMAA